MFSSFNRKNPIVLIMAMVLFYGLQNVCFGQAAIDVGNDSKHKHDGFYLRLASGFGGTAAVEDYDGDEFIISGESSNTTIGIGYALRENFIVNLDIFGSIMVDPELEINGKVIGEADAEVTFSNVGLGLTYYIMPSNFYLSGSFGFAICQVETDYTTFDTDLGYGLNIMVGKEWWVSDNWGIGIATHLLYSRIPDNDDFIEEDLYLNTASIGFLLSATFN